MFAILIGYTLFFLALFIFLGFGAAVLSAPGRLQKYTLFLSPLIGYAYCTLAGWYFYSSSSRPAVSYIPLILIPPALLLPPALFKLGKRRAFPTVFSRELLPPLAIALVVYLLLALPMFRYPELTCCTFGNNDIAFNSLVAQVIKNFPKSGYQGIDFFWPPSLVGEHIAFAPFGTYFISAFMSTVAGLPVYQVQMLLLYLFTAFSVLLTFAVARETFGYRTLGAGFVSLLFGLNSLTYYVVYHGFQHQTIGLALFLALVLVGSLMTEKPEWKHALLLVPLFWALSITYIHMLCLFLAFFSAILVWLAFRSGFRTRAYQAFLLLAFSFAVMVLVAPARFNGSLRFLLWVIGATQAAAGWFIRLPSIAKIFGLAPFPRELCLNRFLFVNQLKLQNFLVLLVSGLVLGIVIEGLYHTFQRDRATFFKTLFLLSGFSFAILFLAFRGRTDAGWGGYKSFKMLSFSLPILLAASMLSLRDMTIRLRDRREELLGIFMLLLLLLNLNTATRTAQRSIWMAKPISPDTVYLSRLRNLPAVHSVNIPGEDTWWNILWETYFLVPRKLYFEQGTYFMPSKNMAGDWWLVRKSGGLTRPDLTRGEWGPVITINQTYSLARDRLKESIPARE